MLVIFVSKRVACKLADARRRVRVTMTSAMVEGLDRLVEEGAYIDRQTAMRVAVRRFLQYHKVWPFSVMPALSEH